MSFFRWLGRVCRGEKILLTYEVDTQKMLFREN